VKRSLVLCICLQAFSAAVGAEWISAADAPAVDEAVKRSRRAPDGTSWFCATVGNPTDVRRAIWRVTALGVFDVYVNASRVGKDFLKPGYTHPRKLRYRYDYDVTSLFRTNAGEKNVLAAEVSHGWWSDNIAGYPGRKPAFWGELEVVYADGTRRVFGTNRTEWRAGVGGPVVHAGIYDGETNDARIDVPSLGSDSFGPPEANSEFSGEILPVAGAKVILRHDLAMSAVALPIRLAPGVTNVVDFGQNCAAVPFFRFRARRGTTLTALPGETVNPTGDRSKGDDGAKGTVHRENLRHPEIGMRVDYTFRGEGVEEYHPRFTFFGYRYLALTATDEVGIERLESVPVTSIASDMETAKIEIGDPTLNRFVENVRWGELSNFLSVPMDCPQRDERLGWTGDAQVFAEAAFYNADLVAFFRKWMRDVRDCQTASGGYASVAPPGMLGNAPMRIGYADAGVIVPYRTWLMTGDTRILEENFDSMDRFLRHVSDTRYAHADIRSECRNYQYADWLSFERYESFDLAWGGGRNGKFELSDEIVRYWDFLGGCYWLLDARMMERMARALGRDAAPYASMATAARVYLRETFFGTDGLLPSAWRDMQTPVLFALGLGLVEGDAKGQMIASLKRNFATHDGRLQTGFLGTSVLMDTLVENGLTDLAYDLLFKRGCPGWLHAVENGATTVWERWNGWTPEKGFNVWMMNSFNHYAYGSVVAWIWKNVVGIAADPEAPGFRRIRMAPKPDRRVGSVKASYRSAAGMIRSDWRYEGDEWVWEFSVPKGSEALVTLPRENTMRTYGAGDYCLRQAERSGTKEETMDCQGSYKGHLQGVATDGEFLYWSFTVTIVKTDLAGKVVAAVEVPRHHGDLCVRDGVVYVAVNLGWFNFEDRGISEVRAYSAGDLSPVGCWKLPMCGHGAGGMTYADGRFFVVGGLPATHEKNYVYEFTPDFDLVHRHELMTGQTLMGIQTAAFEDGRFLFGIYGCRGNPPGSLECPRDLKSFTRRLGSGNVGVVKLGGTYWTGRIRPLANGLNGGCLVRSPNYPLGEEPCSPKRTGLGTIVVFHDKCTKGRWVDSGYALGEDGYHPLCHASRTNGVYFARSEISRPGVVLRAVGIGGSRSYSAPDLVRAVRRVAETDEAFALHVDDGPAGSLGDRKLADALAQVREEASRLGVRFLELNGK